MKYEEMLKRAYEDLPEILKEESRFQIPIIDSAIQGRNTVLINFQDISKALNRSPDMLAKYFLGEMGTGGELSGGRLILKGSFKAQQLQDKLVAFVNAYVMCMECNRPDTKIIQENRMSFLKCEACGARHPIGTIKQETKPMSQQKDLEIGDEIIVQITKTGKKGDGMAKHGRYLVFVNNSREGQKIKARVTGISKTMAFAEIVQVL